MYKINKYTCMYVYVTLFTNIKTVVNIVVLKTTITLTHLKASTYCVNSYLLITHYPTPVPRKYI